MARLIDADWLLNATEKLKVRNTSNTATIFDVLGVLDDVEKIIKAAPINEPVKHGHWIHVDELPSGDYFKCSECNNHIFLKFGWKISFESPADKYKYCPNCGARMENNAND